jgi:hypothetical protein
MSVKVVTHMLMNGNEYILYSDLSYFSNFTATCRAPAWQGTWNLLEKSLFMKTKTCDDTGTERTIRSCTQILHSREHRFTQSYRMTKNVIRVCYNTCMTPDSARISLNPCMGLPDCSLLIQYSHTIFIIANSQQALYPVVILLQVTRHNTR